jgi:WD40 repeat protein
MAASSDLEDAAKAFKDERQKAVASQADHLMPAFPLSRADEFARRAEQAMQAGQAADSTRLYREARWRVPPTPSEAIPYLSRILGSPRLKHAYWVSASAWNTDGSLLASAGHDARVRVWDMRNGRLIRDYRGHGEAVRAVSFLPSGKVISASGKELRVWDPMTGADVKVLAGNGSNIKSLAVQPAGILVAAGGDDRAVRVWDIETGKEVYSFGPFNAPVEGLAWSANGSKIAAVTGDGTLAVWDADKERKKLLELKTTSGVAAYGVRFAPDGKTVATCGEKSARIYALPALGDKMEPIGAMRRSFEGIGAHTDMVTCLAYSPDGKTLATGGRDHSVRIWDVNTGQRQRTLLGHTDKVNAVAFSPDGGQLVSASDDQTIRLWDLAPIAPTASFGGHKGAVWTVAVSPDGTRAATAGADRVIRIWESATGKEIRAFNGHTAAVTALAWTPDGQTLISASADKTIRVWDMSSSQARVISGPEAAVLAVALSPDGRRIAAGGSDRKVRIFDRTTGQQVSAGAIHAVPVTSIAWRSDGNQLASVSVDGILKLWNMATDKEIANARVHDSGGAAAVTFTPDGSRLITCGGDSQIKIWGATAPFAKEPLFTLAGHSGPVSSLSISANGKLLASGGADAITKVWDLTSNPTEMQSFRGYGEWVADVAMSRDGATLVSADTSGKVLVWSLEANQSDMPGGHTRSASAIAASPGTLATGSQDRTAIVWDLATGRERRVFAAHAASLLAVAISSDGNRLVTSAEDRRVRVFDVPNGKELRIFEPMERMPVLAIYPDGKRILAWQARNTGGDDEVTSIISRFNSETGQIQELIAEKGRGVAQCLAFSPDLSLAAVGSTDGKLHVWKIDDKKKLGEDRNAHAVPIADVAITPDNKKVISLDDSGEAKVWPTGTDAAEPIARAKTGTAGTHQGLAISPDGRRFVAYGSSREVAVLETMSGQPIRRWTLPQRSMAAIFTADGKQLAVANDDGTVYLLDLP